MLQLTQCNLILRFTSPLYIQQRNKISLLSTEYKLLRNLLLSVLNLALLQYRKSNHKFGARCNG